MSNALAIATVTTGLAQIIRGAVQTAVPGADVVTERPDATTSPSRRVHLYLYQVSPNAALRNSDLPTRNAEGRLVQRPQVALDLHFLLAFYGNEKELEPQRMLGAVARDLHALPVLTRQMIADAIASQSFLAGSNLADSFEQIKFAPSSLSLEEMSKLWSVLLQTPYALSVVYQGTVVLIDAVESAPQALPVLTRGKDDRGFESQVGSLPFLEGVHIGEPGSADLKPRPRSYPSAQFGAQLTLLGGNLTGDVVEVRFKHPRRSTAVSLIPSLQTATEIRVDLPALADQDATKDQWLAGIYTIEAVIQNGGVERSTGALPIALAPRITTITPTWPNPVIVDPNAPPSRTATITVDCSPKVLPKQSAVLLLADREVQAEKHDTAAGTLMFIVNKAPKIQDELVRLRVDGVTSLPFKSAGDPPQLFFDDSQRMTIP